MLSPSDRSELEQSIAALQAARDKGQLEGHPSQAALAVQGREVLASWGTAMRR